MEWVDKIVDPVTVLRKIKPGMTIFLGTGVSEPQTLTNHLMKSDLANLADLELIQLVNFSGSISSKTLNAQKYRLKTFYSEDVVNKAILNGHVDHIPCRFGEILGLFISGRIEVDAAFIQISPPDLSGTSSLGISLDVAKAVMERSNFVVGEINQKIPRCLGDTFVKMSEFDLLINSIHDPVYFERWQIDPPFDQICEKIALLIPDKSCISFSIGPLFESLGKKLLKKQHLGVHSPIFTDALMDLVESGAVTNLYKTLFPGKSIASYAFGTPELMDWIGRNPRTEFHDSQTVFDPINIGKNPGVITVIPARKIDLYGRIALHKGKGNLATGPMELVDFFMGARISKQGHTIFGIPSRNRNKESNIKVTIEGYQNQFGFEELIEMVVTEYGIAMLRGLSIRERAQALIDIAHPDDRHELVEQAKEQKILYPDQIFLSGSTNHYLDEQLGHHTFKDQVTVRFRGIRPSDEDQMRKLFYRFSDKSIYSRYFNILKTMPHSKMQKYVNIDWNDTASIVGLVGKTGSGKIIAEARYLKALTGSTAEVAFIVDEKYNSLGIATHLYKLLRRIGKKRGITAFTAEVLCTNIGMMKAFKKVSPDMATILIGDSYNVVMPIEQQVKNKS
ncbi:MAG: GNAT family N-acetyltransferase [Desulfobacteraceae bacterium]|nr:GNAT family N-acetyltransferase [Desulfobacteraceae bacterium]